MTIRNLLAATTMCGVITLTGCSSKEAVKIDMAPPSTTTTTAIPASDETNRTSVGQSAASVEVESISASADRTTEHPDNAGKETRLVPVYFGFDSFLLSLDARDALTRNARWLEDNRHLRVIIEGHADERGSDEYNLALGEKRALAAQRYIETIGINRDRMETISYGEEKPAVTGHDDAALAKNRRVEFVIVK